MDEIKRKEELIKMIEECENEQFLTFLYSMIISFKKSGAFNAPLFRTNRLLCHK